MGEPIMRLGMESMSLASLSRSPEVGGQQKLLLGKTLAACPRSRAYLSFRLAAKQVLPAQRVSQSCWPKSRSSSQSNVQTIENNDEEVKKHGQQVEDSIHVQSLLDETGQVKPAPCNTLDEAQAGAPLLDALAAQANSGDAPFHFPGHKRGAGAPEILIRTLGERVLAHDLPELPELDNLFAAEGVILEAQEQAARVFGADKTFFLVNGSTVGVQAAIMASCPPGKVLVLPRNAHQCAVSAMILSGSEPKYVLPEYDSQWDIALGVDPERIRAALNEALAAGRVLQGSGSESKPDAGQALSEAAITSSPGRTTASEESDQDSNRFRRSATTSPASKAGTRASDSVAANGSVPAGSASEPGSVGAVLVISPTYHGICSDIKAIAAICHDYGVPLIVDEAHGGHFTFHEDLPAGALQQGADVAVQSTHKVLGSLTQSAMLHVRGDRVDHSRVARCLQLLQSSSPSYLLLGSLDAATWQMGSPAGKASLARALSLAREARDSLSSIPGVQVLGPDDLAADPTAGSLPGGRPGVAGWDPLRITISTSGLDLGGYEADDLFRLEYGVVAELPSLASLTFVFSAGTTKRHVDRLVEACRSLSQAHSSTEISTSLSGASLGKVKVGDRQRVEPQSRLAVETASEADTAPGSQPSSGPGSRPSAEPAYEPGSEPRAPPTLPPAVVPTAPAVLTPREAFFAESTRVPICDAIGRLCAELLCPYPPGIPVLAPGEVVSEEVVNHLKAVLGEGGSVSGAGDSSLETLAVLLPTSPSEPKGVVH